MAASLRTWEGGPQLDPEALSFFEKKHGVALPASYREFLLATNGGRPERDLLSVPGLQGNVLSRIHLFFGLNDPIESCNLDWNLKIFGDRIPAGFLPIGTTEGVDKICLSALKERAGAVFYWDGHARGDERSLHFLAEDFASFISSLQADELSPSASSR
jgi:hypothetical protein